MNTASVKQHAFRGLLTLHLIGLAMTLGTRLASRLIDRATAAGGLQLIAYGRDLTSHLAQTLVLPGFLLMVATGIAMVLLRYGRRPPIWVWIKVGLNAAALFVATLLVSPALQGARSALQWSVEHNQLAPEFHDSAAKASLYGGIVFVLFVLNIPVAIWKPFLSLGRRRSPLSVTTPESGRAA